MKFRINFGINYPRFHSPFSPSFHLKNTSTPQNTSDQFVCNMQNLICFKNQACMFSCSRYIWKGTNRWDDFNESRFITCSSLTLPDPVFDVYIHFISNFFSFFLEIFLEIVFMSNLWIFIFHTSSLAKQFCFSCTKLQNCNKQRKHFRANIFRLTLLRVWTSETDRNNKLRRYLYPGAARNAPIRKSSWIGILI